MDTPDLDHTLKTAGYRVTRPRVRVWAALHAAGGHVTVEQLAEELGDEVDLASVYRTLSLFEELGIARMSRFDDRDPGRWEPSHPDEHFHLVCRSCGEVDHHVGSLVAQIRTHLEGDHAFTVEDVELTVHGLCASCRATAKL